MKTDKEIEEMFGLTREDIEELAAPWEAGEIPGVPVGEVIVGRPLKFGEHLKLVGFKETEQKIERMDKRADSLGMKRSDYLRWLVDRDLAAAGIA
ncbi:hypothetical protein [Adlercreutzia caecimuris]|jgi:hypothetical protein|uniref:Uncharacterized protein n=2 Tax=Adlercreutzia caecimuris TaxID=671266 RepID=R9KUP3_9ACTN|nr:hypothetical protein [Adlercreutzia caecimuris]EOS50008.1 hypothetical protein C811_02473 [Adlercreutzia caecimuris B7]MCI9208444.1 hypothetical protein [Adlercreutzia caecimuris]MCR2037603.1 hypothetical protein [Adlercreutzia caecimuris]NBJ66380.1 hypothetical protein [Adlercreutzia caecimuris]THG37976.1 hypothetical protein E5986_03705 [Adlercreutzia caecimuris]